MIESAWRTLKIVVRSRMDHDRRWKRSRSVVFAVACPEIRRLAVGSACMEIRSTKRPVGRSVAPMPILAARIVRANTAVPNDAC